MTQQTKPELCECEYDPDQWDGFKCQTCGKPYNQPTPNADETREEAWKETTRLRQQLKIAKAALEHYSDEENWICLIDSCTDDSCEHGEMEYLGEVSGYKLAQQVRAEIEKLEK